MEDQMAVEGGGGMETDDDEGPIFINPDDVTEVIEFGDDDAPPSDSDDDEMGGMDAGGGGSSMAAMEEVVDSPQLHVRFQGHQESVYGVAAHPTQEGLILSGGGADAFLWNAVDGSLIAELPGHTDSIIAVAFSTDGTLCATAGMDGQVKIWDGLTGVFQRALEGPSEQIEWIKWHSKGNVILAGCGDCTCWMWLATTGACMQVFAGHEGSVTCGSFTSSGKAVVTGSADGSLRIWSPKSGACLHTFSGHYWHEAAINVLAVHPTTPLLLTGGQDCTCRLVHVQNRKFLGTLDHGAATKQEAKIAAVGLRHAQKQAKEKVTGYTAGADGKAEEFTAAVHNATELQESNEIVGRFTGDTLGDGANGIQMDTDNAERHGVQASVETVALCGTQNWAATGAMDGYVIIWDLSVMQVRHKVSRRQVQQLNQIYTNTDCCLTLSALGPNHQLRHEDGVTRVMWHSQQPIVFTASCDRKVRTWDARTGTVLHTLLGHQVIHALSAVALQGDSCVKCCRSLKGASRVY
jgi:WD40 repeat protein